MKLRKEFILQEYRNSEPEELVTITYTRLNLGKEENENGAGLNLQM